MLDLDFNNAAPNTQSGGTYDPIPPGSCVLVQASLVRPDEGRQGDNPLLSRSAQSTTQYCTLEMTVQYGRFKGNSFRRHFILDGAETPGQNKAIWISRKMIRAIIEASRDIAPDDNSPDATKARRIADLQELDGMVFPAVVGCEPSNRENPGTPGYYYVRNTLDRVVSANSPENDKLREEGEIITDNPLPKYPVSGGLPGVTNKDWTGSAQQQDDTHAGSTTSGSNSMWRASQPSTGSSEQATPPPPAKERATPSWAQMVHARDASDEVPF